MLKLTDEQLDWLLKRIPQSPPSPLGGLPLSITTASSPPDESQLVQPLFDFILGEHLPERLVGDKAYDSDKLDAELAKRGIEMIAPHRNNRKPENKTQDGRALRRIKRRWTVERTIGWLQNFRRLYICWEKSTPLYEGLLHLSCAILLFREFLG